MDSFSTMDSHAYLADCRVKAMRMLSTLTGLHAEGLAQAARVARKTNLVSNTMCKKLVELDSAFHYSKHASELNSARFISRLSKDIENQSKPSQNDNPHDASTEKPVLWPHLQEGHIDVLMDEIPRVAEVPVVKDYDTKEVEYEKPIQNLPIAAVVTHVQAQVTEEVTTLCRAEAQKHYEAYEKTIAQLKSMVTTLLNTQEETFIWL